MSFLSLLRFEYGCYINELHATLNALLLYAIFLIANNAHLCRYNNHLHQSMVKEHIYRADNWVIIEKFFVLGG